MEFYDRIGKCIGTPQILKGPNMRRFAQLLFPPRVALGMLHKWFKMSGIPNYDSTTNS